MSDKAVMGTSNHLLIGLKECIQESWQLGMKDITLGCHAQMHYIRKAPQRSMGLNASLSAFTYGETEARRERERISQVDTTNRWLNRDHVLGVLVLETKCQTSSTNLLQMGKINSRRGRDTHAHTACLGQLWDNNSG